MEALVEEGEYVMPFAYFFLPLLPGYEGIPGYEDIPVKLKYDFDVGGGCVGER